MSSVVKIPWIENRNGSNCAKYSNCYKIFACGGKVFMELMLFLFMAGKIPVILDTDIGTDIDDTWALGVLLNSPELDLKLITVSTGDVRKRASIAAKFCEMTGNKIPIGLGIKTEGIPIRHFEWVNDYDVGKYPGGIIADGVQAIIDTIKNSSEQVIIIGIGPLPTVAAALERDPTITEKARFIGMHGSIRKGYKGRKKPDNEYNVVQDADACRKVFQAPWDVLVTPLDTCGIIQLKKKQYKRIYESNNLVPRLIMENYRIWSKNSPKKFKVESSILFDTVAIYLAIDTSFVEIECLPIMVTDKGATVEDELVKKLIGCALKWNKLEDFYDWLLNRLDDR